MISKKYINKMNNKKFQLIFWTALSQATVAFFSILSLRIFTEYSDPQIYGEAFLIIGLQLLLINISIGPYHNTQIRYQASYENTDLSDFSYWILKKSLIAGAFLSVFELVAWAVIPHKIAQTDWVSVIAFILLYPLLSAIRNTGFNFILAKHNVRHFAFWQMAEGGIYALVTSSLLLIDASISSFMYGQLIGIAVSATWSIRQLRINFAINGGICWKSRPDLDKITKQYGLPFSAMSFLGWLTNMSDRYILAGFLGVGSAGVYVAAYAIPSRVSTAVGEGLSTLFRSYLFEASNRGKTRYAKKIFRAWLLTVMGISIMSSFVIWLASPLIFQWLLAATYREPAQEIVGWLCAGTALFSINQTLEYHFLSRGNSKRLLKSRLFISFISILSSVILIGYNGILGAAQATFISYLFQFIILILLVWRINFMFILYSFLKKS